MASYGYSKNKNNSHILVSNIKKEPGADSTEHQAVNDSRLTATSESRHGILLCGSGRSFLTTDTSNVSRCSNPHSVPVRASPNPEVRPVAVPCTSSSTRPVKTSPNASIENVSTPVDLSSRRQSAAISTSVVIPRPITPRSTELPAVEEPVLSRETQQSPRVVPPIPPASTSSSSSLTIATVFASTPITTTATTIAAGTTTITITTAMASAQPPPVLPQQPISGRLIVGSIFPSPAQLIQRVRAKAMPELSSVLRLDSSVLLRSQPSESAAAVATNSEANNSLQKEPTHPNPRGHHVCLYCRRFFSSAALYTNHVNRPVARVIYRCHLCPLQGATAPTPTIFPALSPSTQDIPGGNVSAPNLCALFVHMASSHANEPVSAWSLIRSRLSITAIPWHLGETADVGDTESGLVALAPLPAPPPLAVPVYVNGQELVDLENDVDRRITNLLRTKEFRFMPATSGQPSERSFLRDPDIQLTINSESVFSPSPKTPLLTAVSFPLSLGLTMSHLLIRFAEGSCWQGQFFLSGWYPRVSPSSLDRKSSNRTDTSFFSQPDPGGVLLPPPAPSREQIEQAYFAMLTPDPTHSMNPKGVLRCLVCGEFRTNSPTALRHHFSGVPGSSDVIPAKCALCSLFIAHTKSHSGLCSIKTHLLFHLGVFLVCPQCGFTPPPDLPPPLAEICLRLHLRFSCFHFNVSKVLLCGRLPCRDKIFVTMENFVHHWFECHTARKYVCLICSTNSRRGKLEEAPTNGPCQSGLARIRSSCEFPDVDTVRAHLDERHSIQSSNLTAFSQILYECSECTYASPVPVDFAGHFSTQHCRPGDVSAQGRTTPCISQCYYRCFGECKRLIFDAKDFHNHLRGCPHAIGVLWRTFSRDLLNIPLKTPPAEQPQPGTGEDQLRSGNPLCFCLYCGIDSPKSVSKPPIRVAPEGVTDVEATPDPTDHHAEVMRPVVSFSDLASLHHHEQSEHVICNGLSGQIGCPWCGEKLVIPSTNSPDGVGSLLDHLAKHAKANPYVAWHLSRTRRFKERSNEVVLCQCQSGCLDSPLAVLAHASTIPIASSCLRRSRKRRRQYDNQLLFPSFSVDEESPGHDPNPLDSSRGKSPIVPLSRPGGHPPVSTAIYDHLRFGELHHLDARLGVFSATLNSTDCENALDLAIAKAFTCPICQTVKASRWALTEHAFHSHWLRLCYVCCDYVHDDKQPPSSTEDSTTATTTTTIWEHIFQCLTKRHKLLVSADGDKRPKPHPSKFSGDIDNPLPVGADSVVLPNQGRGSSYCQYPLLTTPPPPALSAEESFSSPPVLQSLTL